MAIYWVHLVDILVGVDACLLACCCFEQLKPLPWLYETWQPPFDMIRSPNPTEQEHFGCCFCSLLIRLHICLTFLCTAPRIIHIAAFLFRVAFVGRLKCDMFGMISRLLRISANVAFSCAHFSFAFSLSWQCTCGHECLVNQEWQSVVGQQFQISIGSKYRTNENKIFAIVLFRWKSDASNLVIVFVSLEFSGFAMFIAWFSCHRYADVMGENDDYSVVSM